MHRVVFEELGDCSPDFNAWKREWLYLYVFNHFKDYPQKRLSTVYSTRFYIFSDLFCCPFLIITELTWTVVLFCCIKEYDLKIIIFIYLLSGHGAFKPAVTRPCLTSSSVIVSIPTGGYCYKENNISRPVRFFWIWYVPTNTCSF